MSFCAITQCDGEIFSHGGIIGSSPIMTEEFVIPVRGFCVIFGLDPKNCCRRIYPIVLQEIVVSSTTMTENINFDNDTKIKSYSNPITNQQFCFS